MGVRPVSDKEPGQVPRIRVAVEFDPSEKNHVDSSFKGESDINLIMARYKKTGVLPDTARQAAARYGDFSQIPDFAEMQLRVIAAREMFEALPAKVRRQFNNDPGEFVEAAQTDEGRDLMKKLGLGRPEEPGKDFEAPSAAAEPPSSSPASPPSKASKKPSPPAKVESDDQE